MTRPDPSMFVSRFARKDDDFYPSPSWCFELAVQMMQHIDPSLLAWENACGDGAGSRVLESAGYTVRSTDLVDRGYGLGGVDFLNVSRAKRVDWIVTNPPYMKGLIDAFIARCLEWARVWGCGVAMLVRNEWDCAGAKPNRGPLLEQSGIYVGKLVLTQRPRWFPKTEDDNAPRHNYCWLFWHGEHGAYGPGKIWYQRKRSVIL